jgi:hypothetical protein
MPDTDPDTCPYCDVVIDESADVWECPRCFRSCCNSCCDTGRYGGCPECEIEYLTCGG